MFEAALALVIFLFPLAYSPGPGNIFFAANGARFGFAATIPANAGYHAATWIATAAIGFGFAAVLDRAPLVFDVIKYAGSAYVLWLAWKLFRSGASDSAGEAAPARFMDGALLLALNPKAYVIIALIFAQFLSQAGDDQALAVLWIATIFTVNNLIAFTLWTIAGDRIARLFRNEASGRRLNMIFGAVLAAVAVWMAAT